MAPMIAKCEHVLHKHLGAAIGLNRIRTLEIFTVIAFLATLCWPVSAREQVKEQIDQDSVYSRPDSRRPSPRQPGNPDGEGTARFSDEAVVVVDRRGQARPCYARRCVRPSGTSSLGILTHTS